MQRRLVALRGSGISDDPPSRDGQTPEEDMHLLKLGAAAAVLAVTLSGCGDDEPAPTTQTNETTTTATQTTETTTTAEPEVRTVRIVVQNAAPEGGIVRETVEKGDRVLLVVKSDVADEIHLHGYDASRDVEAGGTARLAFTAKLVGRFEVELEQRGVPIAEITVEP
jgi:hypothetical protein